MVRNGVTVDISESPELARLAEAVRATGEPCVLRRGEEEIAVIVPALPPVERAQRTSDKPRETLTREERIARDRAIVARTTGALKQYVPSPPLTRAQEREAFEQGVADQVMESSGLER